MTTLSEAQLKDILKANPDLRIFEARAFVRPAIPVTIDEKESITQRFERIWAELGGPPLVKEFEFHPVRKWKFDYANPEKKIGIEIHGGIHTGGRHIRPIGFLRDREKMNAAQILGWQTCELGTGQVTEEFLRPWVERMSL